MNKQWKRASFRHDFSRNPSIDRPRLTAAGVTTLLFFTIVSTLWAEPTPVGGEPAHAPAPIVEKAGKQTKEGEMDVTIKGQAREKLQVGKLDPPAAFNLEDIQNFPEERLQPVLNNPLTFEEGRDFSVLMDFQDEQPMHPWLPALPRAPFLRMKTATGHEKTQEWTFSIIDQAGTPVSQQQGKGNPPPFLIWNGEDSRRGHVSIDTVYIPQLATVDKQSYHHTWMGQPILFSTVLFKDQGKTIIELSSKRLFLENKAEFTKEAYTLLEKVCDALHEEGKLSFAIQPYEADPALARTRQKVLVKYFSEKLVIPENQIIASNPEGAEKRGAAMAIITNTGGTGT